jgi:tRNA U34 5-methylaminomethyl-2-thiouridine-forming methyltransferase MnmC
MVCQADPVRILEVGFGTGLNALLTAISSRSEKRKVFYTSVEKFPLDDATIGSLNHADYAGESGRETFQAIHSASWNKSVRISDNFFLEKTEADFITMKLKGKFDLIYFDAFGPDKQPDMWTSEVFSKISAATDTNGILVTYSAKGEVKRSLRSCGFEVTLIPGPPGKRQMIRAFKI